MKTLKHLAEVHAQDVRLNGSPVVCLLYGVASAMDGHNWVVGQNDTRVGLATQS